MEGESNSISNQKTLLTNYAKKNGFRNVKVFIDDGISGVTFNRQGFKELMKLIEDGQVKIPKLSRKEESQFIKYFGRSNKDKVAVAV